MFSKKRGCFDESFLPAVPFGIGDFGHGGYQFVDLLCEMRMRWWQILPLCPIERGIPPIRASARLHSTSFILILMGY